MSRYTSQYREDYFNQHEVCNMKFFSRNSAIVYAHPLQTFVLVLLKSTSTVHLWRFDRHFLICCYAKAIFFLIKKLLFTARQLGLQSTTGRQKITARMPAKNFHERAPSRCRGILITVGHFTTRWHYWLVVRLSLACRSIYLYSHLIQQQKLFHVRFRPCP